jgi:calcyphosin
MSHAGYLSHNESEMIYKSKRKLDSGRITDPVEALRYLCLARGYSGFLGFGRSFREMDNGKKFLNLQEFIKALHNTGLELPEGEAEEVFRRFDVDGTGGINIENLLDGIRVS